MKSKTVIILGADYPQIPAIERAHKLGFKVICADQNPEAPGLSISDYPLPGISTHDPDEIIKAVKKLQQRNVNPDGVLTMAVEASFSAARVCRQFGLPSASVEVVDRATDKIERLKAWKAAGVPCPEFGFASNVEEAVAVAHDIGFPVVLKPTHKAGARGVVRCNCGGDVRDTFSYVISHSHTSVLIEEFLEGTEHSSESLVVAGCIYTTGFSDRNYDTKYKYPPYFLENGDTIPTALPENVYNRTLEEIENAIRALGIDFGPAKGDILVTREGKPYMLEMAARLSGDYFCSFTAPLSNGTDIISAALQQCTGSPVDKGLLTPKYNKAVALRYFWPEPLPGKVISISGVEECRALPGVEFVTWEPYWIRKSLDVGTVIEKPTCHGERVGCVLTVAENLKKTVELAEKVVSKIKIGIAPR